MTRVGISLVFMLALSGLLTVIGIGQQRQPLTPKAALSVLVNAVYVFLILTYGTGKVSR